MFRYSSFHATKDRSLQGKAWKWKVLEYGC